MHAKSHRINRTLCVIDDGLDEESEDEETKDTTTSKPTTPEPPVIVEVKPPPEVSNNVKFLLKTLEFNQIDMYR